jgi:branched-chain amino acid transport system permease protein
MSLTVHLNIVASGLLTGLVYGLAALGVSLIFAVTRAVSLAHGALMALGLAGAAALAARHGIDPFLATPVVATCLFLAGFLLHRLLIGPAVDASERGRLLMPLGLAPVLIALAALLPRSVPAGPRAIDTLAFGPLLFDRIELRAGLMALIIVLLLALFFNFSHAGKAIRACADNPLGARGIGLNLGRLQAVAFGLGAGLAGIAGCLLAESEGIRPAAAPELLLPVLAAALIGGLGSVEGALVGGVAVGVVRALAGALLAPEAAAPAACLLALLVLALRPDGLFGRPE